MVSLGMFCAFASETALRRRALESTSPLAPVRVATVISLIIFVKILPRFASSAPFLCLIVCHLECPDIDYLGFRRDRKLLDSACLSRRKNIPRGFFDSKP